MQFLMYKVRCAMRGGKIQGFNFWKGKLSVKLNNKDFHVSHIDDLISLNLAVEEDRLNFI